MSESKSDALDQLGEEGIKLAEVLGIEPRRTSSKPVMLAITSHPNRNKQDTIFGFINSEIFEFAVSILNLVLSIRIELMSTGYQPIALAIYLQEE